MAIYHAKRHQGIVTVDGVEYATTHCDDVMGYAVTLPRDANGLFMVTDRGDSLKREVVRGNVRFYPMEKQAKATLTESDLNLGFRRFEAVKTK